MELQRRNIAILSALITLVVVAASATLLVGRIRRANDENSIGVYDTQLDKHGRQWVDVIFDHPIGVARPGEVVDPPPATIVPSIAGVWRWRAENVLRFAPEGGFAPGTDYRIKLKTPRLIAAGQRFRGDGEVRVSIERLLVEKIITAEEPSAADPRQVVLHGEAHFNYAVDPEMLVTRMWLVDGDERQPIEILTDRADDTMVAFRSKPLPKTKEERAVKFIIDKSMAEQVHAAALEADYVKVVTIGSIQKLVVRAVEPTSGSDESTLKIEMSSALNPDVAAKFVTVQPATKFHVSTQGNDLLLTGAFVPGSSFDLTLGKGLPAVDGATLESDYTTTVTFPDLESKVDFQSEGMFLSASGAKAVAIESTNVADATLAIDRVYRNNIFHLLANDYWYPSHYYGGDEDDAEVDEGTDSVYPISHTLGDQIVRKKIALRHPHNRKAITAISLEPYVKTHEPGLYRVTLHSGSAPTVARWILITDLGIVAKAGSGELLTWVASFKDLSAIGDASVSVISDQNQVIASGRTDARGLWTTKLPAKKRAFMIVVQRGNDFSFLLMHESEIDLSPFDVAGATPGASGYSAFLYGERDIYRPGETVDGLAVVRDRALQPAPKMPLVAKHFDGGDLRDTFRITLGDGGAAPFTLKLPPYARTGHHRIDLIAGKDVIGSYFFQVEEFVPDRIKVEVKPVSKNAAPGEDLAYDVSSAYLFGPPAANLAVDARVRILPSTFAPDGFDAYTFGDSDRSFDARELASDSGTLDENGVKRFSVAIPPKMIVPSSLEAVIVARVQEQGGRGVSAVTRVPVHPWPYYLGLRRITESGPSKPVTFEWVALGRDGQPVKSNTLRAELVQETWHTVLRKTSNGSYNYQSTRDATLLASKEIAAGETRGSFTFIGEDYRQYRVVLSDPATGAASAIEFSAGGWGYSPWAMKNPGRLQLALDKDDYAPGEVASLQVKAPFSGKLLVTVERDDVTYTAVESMKDTNAIVKVPLTAALRPNAFITATLVRAAGDLEPGDAGRAFGAIAVNVDREANELHPRITATAEMRSSRKLPVEVTTEPGSIVTIAAVDEGILQLIAQKTPDPFSFFYRRLALNVASYDIFAQLLPEVRPKGKANVGGSENMEGMAQYVRADSIRRAKPVAYWSGSLRAGSDGKARFTFDVPDFNGGIRVMAVVHHGRRFGRSEASVKVHDPLVLTVTTPRFLATDDQVSVPVTVRNDTGKAGEFVILSAAKDLVPSSQPPRTRSFAVFAAQDDKPRPTSIPNHAERTVYLPLHAPQTPGDVTMTITASGNGEKATQTITIPVRWSLPIESEETAGAMTQPAIAFTGETKPFVAASVERTLVVSPVPLARFRGKLTYLLHYPYGCVEQTTSSVFPLVYFADLAQELDPDAFAKGDSAALIRAGVLRLGTMQTPTGGFAMWPYGSTTYPWGTTYATHFLVEARRAGHEVEPAIYDNALRYLATDAKAKPEYDTYELERVTYDLYVLARAGKPDLGTMDYIREHQVMKLNPTSRAMLAAAYAAAGNPKMIDTLLASVTDAAPVERMSGGTLDSTARNRALLLIALLDAAPNDPRIAPLVDRLVRDASDPWCSTQESSLAFIALGQFYRRQRQTASYSGAVFAGKQLLGNFTAKTAVFRNIKGTAPIRIVMNGGYVNGAAFYSLTTRGVKNVVAFHPESAGIELTRTFFTRDGKPLDPSAVQQGDLIICQTRVRSANGALDNVVVQNLIPAGLEVENPRLRTTESFTWITGDMSECTNADIRDDQVLYFIELPPAVPLTFYTLLRAVTPGTFALPPAYAEAMYVRANHAVGERGTLVVRPR